MNRVRTRVFAGGMFFDARTAFAYLALGLRICVWLGFGVLVGWTVVKAWGWVMRLRGGEFTLSNASPLAPGTGLKADVCVVTWASPWFAVDIDNWSSVLVPEEIEWPLVLLRREDTGSLGVLTFPSANSTSWSIVWSSFTSCVGYKLITISKYKCLGHSTLAYVTPKPPNNGSSETLIRCFTSKTDIFSMKHYYKVSLC